MDWSIVPNLGQILEDLRLEVVAYTHQDFLSTENILIEIFQKCWSSLGLVKRLNPFLQLIIGAVVFSFWILLALKLFQSITIPCYASGERMDDKTVLITGSNRGRGLEVARELANRGARIILACRNMQRGEEAMKFIRKTANTTRLSLAKIDFSDMMSIRNLAHQVLSNETRLDVLICNGSVSLDRLYRTETGVEVHLATNYLGFFLLSNLLLSLLSSSDGRILLPASQDLWSADLEIDNLNSELRFNKKTVFANSQLANLLFTRQLAVRCAAAKIPVAVNCFDIGKQRTSFNWFSATREHNAVENMVHLAVSKDGKKSSGNYFSECKIAKVSEKACDSALAEKLWNFSTFFTNLQEEESIF